MLKLGLAMDLEQDKFIWTMFNALDLTNNSLTVATDILVMLTVHVSLTEKMLQLFVPQVCFK